MGVSCSADRNIKGKINKDGIWLEKLDTNPGELIPEEYRKPGEGSKGIEIDLDKGIDAVRSELTKYPVSTRVSLKGTIIVARDIAHAKLKARLDAGEPLPQIHQRLSSIVCWSCKNTKRTTLWFYGAYNCQPYGPIRRWIPS